MKTLYAIVITRNNYHSPIVLTHVESTLIGAKRKATELYRQHWDWRDREIYIFESNISDDYYRQDAVCYKSHVTGYKW